MAQQTDYMNEPMENAGGHAPYGMAAEMGLFIGAGWAGGIAERAFKKYGRWKGSAAATNAYYGSMRKGATTWGAFGAKKGLASAMPIGKYANALSMIKARGGGMFSFRTAKAAARLGVGKQFAMLAASGIGKAVLAGLNVAMWAPMVYQGIMGTVTGIRSVGRSVPRQEFGNKFQDTQGSYTERQRAVRSITSSRLSTRSAIGNEAQLMHR